MRPFTDYFFIAIETAFTLFSLILMVPCTLTLLRTKGIHENCKILIITSAVGHLLMLVDQLLLSIHNIAIDNILPRSSTVELPFLCAQNGLFILSSHLSFVLVLERCLAIWDPARYEAQSRHLLLLFSSIFFAAAIAALDVYMIFWHNWNMKIIYVVYAVEGCTIIISIVIIFFCRWKLIREVLRFSVAILPSIVLSSIMHTISLIPSILFQYGVIDWALSCLFYFSVHSLNCVVTKITLILFHPAMRIKLRSMLFTRLQLVYSFLLLNSPRARVKTDAMEETNKYFDQLQNSWATGAPVAVTRK